ncbi:DoxX family protein [Brevibacterium sp. CBA3109]|uniref:DoxX family protein n=1 Tax=Brevibacterium koreense TaxID=3140787 RepID=A0AAU7UQJ3_9MICO
MAHGWEKFNKWTVSGTTQRFAQMGVPLPDIAAPFATFIELIGGALLLAAMGPGRFSVDRFRFKGKKAALRSGVDTPMV